MLQFNSPSLVSNSIGMRLSNISQKDNCDSGGVLFKVIRAKMPPPHRHRPASVSEAIWLLSGTYRRIDVSM
jgi:hypothetical protein